MLLLLLLALGAPSPQATPLLSIYHRTALEYRGGDRDKALREIRRWGSREIHECVQALREEGDRRETLLLPSGAEVAELPVEIDFRTVEAATLMHVEAGLLELQSFDVKRAKGQLSAATSLVEWSQKLARKRREAHPALMERLRRKVGQPDPALSDHVDRALLIELRIDPREFHVALAAATLAVGFPEVALPFAGKATAVAPLDGEALLLAGSVKESLAFGEAARGRDRGARRRREEAAERFREALATDPAPIEASLRLGRILLTAGRAGEAEPLLQQAVERAPDDSQRYLALLFLGRASELRESPFTAATFYRRALEAWPESQAARLGLARSLETSAGPAAAHPLVTASLLESRSHPREPDPWWSYPSGPWGLAKIALERLWQETLGRPFGS